MSLEGSPLLYRSRDTGSLGVQARTWLAALGLLETSFAVSTISLSVIEFDKRGNISFGIGMSVPYLMVAFEGIQKIARGCLGHRIPSCFSEPERSSVIRNKMQSTVTGIIEVATAISATILVISKFQSEGNLQSGIDFSVPYWVLALEGIRRFFEVGLKQRIC